MKTQKNNISQNLSTLRRLHKYSQEDVVEQIGVSRQTAAKWETGETVPDILNCDAPARLSLKNFTRTGIEIDTKGISDILL